MNDLYSEAVGFYNRRCKINIDSVRIHREILLDIL